MSSRPSPIAVVPALLLAVLSVWETCATPRNAAAVPGDKAWEKIEKVVRAGHQPGDLIVFAPAWVEPTGRLHLGDLIPVEMAARMDHARYARIWEISIRDARAPETAGLVPAATHEDGGVTIRAYSRAPSVVVSDIRDRLGTARSDGGRPTLEIGEVGFSPRRCVQVTPQPGRSARITFPAMPLGSTLVGYVGLADVFTRRDIRAPGTLAVEIGGQTVANVTAGVDDGWVRFEAKTTPGPADVTFVATATAPQRLICFAAEARQ